MTKIIRWVERAYSWLLLAPAALPVVVWGGLIYPYLVPKTLLFYAVSLITVGAFALLVAHGHAFYWERLSKWEMWIPGALLSLAYGTSLVGIDFYKSFWSLFVRGDGLLMLTCAIASFYLIVLYADRVFFERLLRAATLVGSFVAVYGIGEWLLGGGRIGSLLGNAAFFAGYLGVTFFATLAAAQTLSSTSRRLVMVGAGLQVVVIILTATRGTILALAVAFVTTLIYFAFRSRSASISAGVRLGLAARSAPAEVLADGGRTVARMTLIVLAVFVGLFFTFRNELAQVSFEPVARIASISLQDGTVSSRLFIWKNMITEIGKSPWLGVGAEHIDTLFNRFYDPTQIVEQWFDRSHNAFLDYTAQYGIGGLLLYLALIAIFFTSSWRVLQLSEPRYALIFSLFAVTYVVQNFFVFDTVSSFWLMLALLANFSALSYGDVSREALPMTSLMRVASWPFAGILLLCIIPISVQPARAAYDLAQAYKYQLTDVPQEISYLSHGFALTTYGNVEYGYEAYDMYANVQANALSGTLREDAYQASLAILTENFNRYPYDARTALYLAHVLSLAPSEVTVDGTLFSSALERAIRLSPKRSQPWYLLANLSISQANQYPPRSAERIAGYVAAQDILTRYIELVPTLSAPYFVLAQLLYASGNAVSAAEEALKGKEYYQEDLETARRATVYYETVLDLPNASFFLQEVVRMDPANTAAAEDLAKIKAYEQSK